MQAINLFTHVLEEQPQNSHALLRRAVSLKCLKDYDRAGDDFEKAKVLESENPAMHIDYHTLGKYQNSFL